MIVQKIASVDLEEIRTLRPDGWSDIVPDFRFYLDADYCYPVKAVIDEQIVGVGAAIIYGDTGWLAHVIVDRNYRKRGIGYRIVQELLSLFPQGKIKTYSLIATELGKPVYRKAGFRTVGEYVFLKREHPWISTSVSSHIHSFKKEYLHDICALDRKISGEDRRKLITGFLKGACVYIQKDKVLGYYLPALKEGPVYADHIEAGLELMKLKYATVDKAVLPSENVIAIDFLKANGFHETDTHGTRMIFGNDIHWIPDQMYSRIGGNLG